MQAYALGKILEGGKIALVPTMGFLHEGHLSLIKEGIKRADHLVVSIFVNPTQFGPGEDLASYPRNFSKDTDLAKTAGADVIFAPGADDLYPENYQTYISLDNLPNHLCGISRPGHFKGVATVVAKLFNIVKPHVAIFGMKDYQQLAVIRQMTKDLNFDIEIIGAPTVREPDGLAMSSRNAYLSKNIRPSALSLFKALNNAQQLVSKGITDSAVLINETASLIGAYKKTTVDYISICDPETLEDIKIIEKQALMAIAVKVDNTRLIDNMMINPNTSSKII
jgi:pantoate--beta-alanine ligase